MADSNWVQSSFLGGEYSPFSQGRVDTPAYRTALNVCRNGYPIEEGAWIRRSGTRFAAATLNGAPGRVIPFDFEKNAPYIMEFTDAALRMYAVATQTSGLVGPLPKDFRLVTTNDNQQVSDISTANPAVVQTGAAHGWASGDQVMFLFASSVNPAFTPLLRNRVFQITVTDTTHFSIADTLGAGAIDGSTLGWSAPAANMVIAVRMLKIVTPYLAGDWAKVRSVQAETEIFLLHGSYQTQALNVLTQPTASAFATFTFAAATFTDGPYLDPPTDGTTITPSAASGTINLTASAITAINGGLGFQSTDVGRSIRVLSEPAAWNAGTAYVVGNSVKYNGTYFSCIQNGTGFVPDAAVAYWGINLAAAAWGWGTVLSVTSTTIVSVLMKGTALVNTNAAATWRLGVYSNTTGWPTCGAYYEGRIWLAGAIANRVDASVVNGIANGVLDMTPTSADGVVSDSSGISYIFNSDDVNPLYWMIGKTGGIVCGTLGGEWLISSPTTGPITPTNIQAHRGTTYGSENIEPRHTGLTISFVQRFARSLLEYFPDAFSGRYTAPDLARVAKHLTKPGIDEIQYQQELLPVIWARCGDGSLVGVTYQRSSLFSSQGADFMGWHRHDFGSLRTVESTASGPSVDGTIDTLALVTNDPATNIRHVELMESLFEVNTDITLGWFLDDAVVPSGGTITYVAGAWALTLYGLWHLNGKSVTVSCGGIDCGDATVANGSASVSIDNDIDALLSTSYLASISSTTAWGATGTPVYRAGTTYTVPCMVGFTYTSQGQILRPDTVDQGKSPTGPGPAKMRRNHQFGVLLEGTQGISFGTNFTAAKMHAANFKSPGGTAYTKLQLFNGVYWDTIEDSWGFDGMLCWQVSRPYPAAVVSISGFMNMSDR